MNSRKIFKALFSEARKAFRNTGSNPAFNAVTSAEFELIQARDFPIDETLAMSRPAIYALHWTRCAASPDVPRYRSEIHRCFIMSENPEESRVWFTSPAERLALLEA